MSSVVSDHLLPKVWVGAVAKGKHTAMIGYLEVGADVNLSRTACGHYRFKNSINDTTHQLSPTATSSLCIDTLIPA